MFLSNLDIDSNFYSDPELKLLFKEEFNSKVPSKVMWAIMMNYHPKSKYASLDPQSRELIIKKDYLDDVNFDFSAHTSTINKVKESLLSPADRFIATWNNKLHELQTFIDEIKVSSETYEIVLKIMKDFHPMMKQYKEIVKEFQKEQELSTFGGIEESLLEKRLL